MIDDIEKYYKSKYKLVAGIDEAGRGALAGPVVAASVILPNDNSFENIGLTDSKKLSEKKREELYQYIIDNSIAYGVGLVDNLEIDKINILNATIKAMHQSIDNLSVKPDYLIIDGNYFKNNGISFSTIIKGDLLCPSISAASIIAKVTRDRLMKEIDLNEFPQYEFTKNKGYGVKKHYEMIDIYGECKYHRTTYLNKYHNNKYNQLFK